MQGRYIWAQPAKGMVWDPPASETRAEKDLIDMKAIGVQAIRTKLLKDEALYRLADSLGLTFYQDFPFDYLPAQALMDTLEYARQILLEASWWAENHSSARHFGLMRHSDTSDPDACSFLGQLVEEAHSLMPDSTEFYYTTSFVEDEFCSSQVDFVMVDALGQENPATLLRRWESEHSGIPLAIGALGSWVDAIDETENGYRRQFSPAHQARYLETHLLEVVKGTVWKNQKAVFVYRWRDKRLNIPSSAHDLNLPYRHTYGILTSRGQERTAYSVVAGIYTGKQEVFAFSAGEPAALETPWIVLLGWLNVALLGFGMSYFPRLRPTIQRYFAAHGFYREAVATGRELLFGPNIVLLIALTLAFSVTMTVILESVRMSEAFSALVRWMPESIRETTILLLGNQPILMLVLACGFAVGVAIWTSVLSAASARSRKMLLPGQAFMLVVWSQWLLLPLLLAAMVISTFDTAYAPRYALALFLALVLSIVVSNTRILHDYVKIIRANPLQFVIAFFGNPFFLILLVGVYWCLTHRSHFAFFLHLIVRS